MKTLTRGCRNRFAIDLDGADWIVILIIIIFFLHLRTGFVAGCLLCAVELGSTLLGVEIELYRTERDLSFTGSTCVTLAEDYT